jgi:sarcosine oxidase, subunit gamma
MTPKGSFKMPEPLKQESPLAQVLEAIPEPATDTGLWLSECPPMGHINLRGDPADLDFAELVRRGTNILLPEVPNTSLSSTGVSALWLGPHEWLIVTSGGLESAVQSSLRETLANRNHAVTDITSGNAVISLSGTRVRDVVAKGCSIDLYERFLGPASCAQTHIAKASVLIWRSDDSSRLNLIVRRSFAEYLALWLQDAGREYGLTRRQ